MNKEIRTVCYDKELKIEAYRLKGIVQSFPSHFHEYYVIGLIEEGNRRLTCKNKEYSIGKGTIILFNPGDSHSCTQENNRTFDYRGLNISKEVMLTLKEEITGKKTLPEFTKNVIVHDELTYYLRPLHQMIMSDFREFKKEEYLLMMITLLIENYIQPFSHCIPECRKEIEKACLYLEKNYSKPVNLNEICKYAGLSKSTLLRAFTKSTGVTPYRYLQTIRINKAKKLLEEGAAPIDAALETGFSDQSHFTNFFNMFIGLTPGAYREIFLGKENNKNSGENT